MKKLLGTLGICLSLASSSFAVGIGLNPATPLGGYNLGGGLYATLIGVQSSSSLVGTTITVADLFGAVNSGTVSGFYYAAGNSVSGNFDNISQFSPFVSDTVLAGTDPARNNRVWDSLYAFHTGTVVFNNGTGGTATMGITGNRITGQNPFQPVPPPSVPDAGSTLALMGIALAALGGLRRKLVC